MTRSLFSLAFDHVEDCLICDLSERQLCPQGRALFEAAQEKCERMVNVELTETTNKA